MNDGNFTKFPNCLLEVLYRQRLSGSDFCVLLFVLRFTRGFNREFHALSVRFIADGTQLSTSTVKDCLRRLRKKQFILSRKGSGSTNELAINYKYLVSSSKENHSAEIHTRTDFQPTDSTEIRPADGAKSRPQERKKVIKKMKENKFDFQAVVNLFQSICVDLPRVTKLTEPRKKAIKRANCDLEGDWRSFFEKIHKSDFLCGRTGSSNFQASFDWCLLPRNMVKIREGNYDNRPNKSEKVERFYSDDFWND